MLLAGQGQIKAKVSDEKFESRHFQELIALEVISTKMNNYYILLNGETAVQLTFNNCWKPTSLQIKYNVVAIKRNKKLLTMKKMFKSVAPLSLF